MTSARLWAQQLRCLQHLAHCSAVCLPALVMQPLLAVSLLPAAVSAALKVVVFLAVTWHRGQVELPSDPWLSRGVSPNRSCVSWYHAPSLQVTHSTPMVWRGVGSTSMLLWVPFTQSTSLCLTALCRHREPAQPGPSPSSTHVPPVSAVSGALPMQKGCLYPAWTAQMQSAAHVAQCTNMLRGIEALSHLARHRQEEVAPYLQQPMTCVLMLSLMLWLVLVPDCPKAMAC